MAIEATRAGAWIYQRLAADATLVAGLGVNPLGGPNIFHRLAHPQAPRPAIVYVQTGGAGDLQTADGRRVFDAEIWQVTLYTDGLSDVTAQPLADRIDAALHQQQGPALDGTVQSCHRTRTFPLPQILETAAILSTTLEFALIVTVP
jgi:hypothetical protein